MSLPKAILSIIGKLILSSVIIGGFALFILVLLGVNEMTAAVLVSQVCLLLLGCMVNKPTKEWLKETFANKPTGKGLFASVGVAVSIVMLNIIIGKFMPENAGDSSSVDILNSSSFFISIITPIIIAPLVEEFTLRASFKKFFNDKGLSNKTFILTSSIIFGVLHIAPNITGLFHVGLATIMGILLGVLYVKTENIYNVILAHLLYNATIVIYANMVAV